MQPKRATIVYHPDEWQDMCIKHWREKMGMVAAAAFTGVAILPCMGWIVRQQVPTVVCGMWTGSTDILPRLSPFRGAIGVRQPPDDFSFALSKAFAQGLLDDESADGDHLAQNVLPHLRALLPRWADQPGLQAALLCCLSHKALTLDQRGEQDMLARVSPDPASLIANKAAPPVSPTTFAEWDAAARAGERLDPTNVFFSLQRAIGLFAIHRDADARAEILHAATLKRYDDYNREAEEARWRSTQVRANDHLSCLMRDYLNLEFSQLLPRQTLALARLTTVQAMQLEQSGRTEEGFALRRALRQCGDRVCDDASMLTTNEAGNRFATLSTLRPDGAAPVPNPLPPSAGGAEKRATQIAIQYEAYLRAIGHGEEIPFVERDRRLKHVLKLLRDYDVYGNRSDDNELEQMIYLWMTDYALIVFALWTLPPLCLSLRIGAHRSKNQNNFVLRCSRYASIPITVLVLLYSVAVVWTSIQETRAQSDADLREANEARFYADRIGIEWPVPGGQPTAR